MKKFLTVLENHDPEMQQNDDTEVLQGLCTFCDTLGYTCSLDGNTLTISVQEEESEDAVFRAVMSTPDNANNVDPQIKRAKQEAKRALGKMTQLLQKYNTTPIR